MTARSISQLTLVEVFPLLRWDDDALTSSELSPTSTLKDLWHGDAPALARLSMVLLRSYPTLPLLTLMPGLVQALDEPVALGALSTRALIAMQRNSIFHWRDLVTRSADDLLSLPGFGQAWIDEIGALCVARCAEVFLDDGERPLRTRPDTPSLQSFRGIALADSPDIVAALAEMDPTVGDLVPELAFRSSNESAFDMMPVRLANRFASITWAELLSMPLRTLLTTPNVGRGSVGALLDRLGELAAVERSNAERPELEEARSAVSVIAGWAVQDRGLSRLGELVGVEPAQAPLPEALAELWNEAVARQQLQAGGPVGEQIIGFLQGLDERERMILGLRVWPPAGWLTLDAIGQKLGMTRERVRQIEVTVVEAVDRRLRHSECLYIRARAGELRHRLGSVAPESGHARGVLEWCVRDVPEAQRVTAQHLLLWLAGPYVLSDGWFRLASGGPDERCRDLASLSSNGFLTDEAVDSALAGMNVIAAVRVEWMEAVGQFVKVDGGWLDRSGSIVDQALRYLAFRGVPLTTEEMLEGIGSTDANVRGVRARLYNDPRAVRVGKAEIGLREWGQEEYTSLPEKMLEELERAGGRMPLALMIERLVDQFRVSANSVKMYAGRPHFLVDDFDFVQLRPDDQPYQVRDDISRVPGCYELGSSVAAWRVLVDREVLRGSGRRMPEQLSGWLGLGPGQVLSLHNSVRPVALVWRSWSQPNIGSLKHLVDAGGASEGDWLVLVFDRAGTVDQYVVAKEPAAVLDLDMLLRLMGIRAEPPLESEAAMATIGSVLGLDAIDPDSFWPRIRAAFEARRDLDIVEMIDARGGD